MNFELKEAKPKKSKALKYDKAIGLFLIISFGLLYLFLALKANLDLHDGKHVLFMDEQIVYNGVEQILSSENSANFINNITHEGDHRYGKILFNINALFSAVPSTIWGDSGQIISIRLTQTLALFIAYLLFCFTFLKSWTLRGLLFILLLSLPSTSYYFTMPKPEPLQILFIALFLFFASKKNYKFGKHWFYLGLAFGAKISAFPILVFYFLVALYQSKSELRTKSVFIKKIMIAVLATISGLLVAEPMLLFGKFKEYILFTWMNTTHGLDDKTVGVIDWIKLTIEECSILHNVILILGLICALYTLLLVFNKKSKFNILDNHKNYVVLFLGFFILLLYMLRVDRLWEFYLQVPLILITVGVLVYVEKLIYQLKFKQRTIKVLAAVIIIPLIFLTGLVVRADNIEYNRLASRTAKPKHVKKILEYDYLNMILDSISNANDKPLNIYFDPNLYLLESNDNYQINKFPGYFTKWNQRFEAIVYYKKQGEHLEQLNISETNVRYKKWKRAIELYSKHITHTNNLDSIKQLIKSDSIAFQNSYKWKTNGDWVIENNTLSKSTNNNVDIRIKDSNFKKNNTYRLSFEIIDYKSGKLFYKFGGGSLNKVKNIKSGKYSFEIVHDGKLANFQLSGSFIGSIKDLNLKGLDKESQNLNQKLIYIKLSDPKMPKDLEVLLRSDVFINYKTQK